VWLQPVLPQGTIVSAVLSFRVRLITRSHKALRAGAVPVLWRLLFRLRILLAGEFSDKRGC